MICPSYPILSCGSISDSMVQPMTQRLATLTESMTGPIFKTTHIIFLLSLPFSLSITFDQWKERKGRLSNRLYQIVVQISLLIKELRVNSVFHPCKICHFRFDLHPYKTFFFLRKTHLLHPTYQMCICGFDLFFFLFICNFSDHILFFKISEN